MAIDFNAHQHLSPLNGHFCICLAILSNKLFLQSPNKYEFYYSSLNLQIQSRLILNEPSHSLQNKAICTVGSCIL